MCELDRRSYLSLFLLGLFNPMVESTRGLCRATALPKVRELAGAQACTCYQTFSEHIWLLACSPTFQLFSPQRNISTGIWQVRTMVVVVLPRMRWRMGLWP